MTTIEQRATCPHHGWMEALPTQYGIRFTCHAEGCTVACWNNDTSLPGDQETRDARHLCHNEFDPLWQRRERFQSRGQAYKWLRDTLGLTNKTAHIGMLSLEQCRRLLEAIRTNGE